MGRGGVKAHGEGIQINLRVNGKRIRPTLDLKPTPANLKYAERLKAEIEQKQKHGILNLADYFPEYKHLTVGDKPTFREQGNVYLKTADELAHATKESYRKILNGFWYPKIGDKAIADISYSDLKTTIAAEEWKTPKTRNNVVSAARRVFEFAYLDEVIQTNPAEKLKSVKVQTREPDPYTLDEALAVIEGHRKLYGDESADYVTLAFFDGLRPSEQIALQWPQVSLKTMEVLIDRARVMAKDKNTTKTGKSRYVTLSPRGRAVIMRQRERTFLAGGAVFLNNGTAFHDEQVQRKRWIAVHRKEGIRYREPYQARHTSVTWHLMARKNFLEVAAKHGHSPAVMLKTYARWLKESEDRLRLEYETGTQRAQEFNLHPLRPAVLAEKEGFEPSEPAKQISPLERKRKL